MRATASVVLSQRIERGTLPKNANPVLCPSQKASAVSRIGLHETGVAAPQVHRKKVDLAFDPRDCRQRLAKIHLRMGGIVPQHLLPDFYSGLTGRPGRFSEGFLRRCLCTPLLPPLASLPGQLSGTRVKLVGHRYAYVLA
jgi:hypothetical protein